MVGLVTKKKKGHTINMAINAKAQKFKDFLTENKLSYFSEDERADELQSVLFRTELDVNGQRLPLFVLTDDSIYTIVKIRVVPNAAKADNKSAILAGLNSLNNKFKIFKYSLSDENDIILDISIPVDKDFFDPRIIMAAIDIALGHLNEEYPNLMRLVWTEQEEMN